MFELLWAKLLALFISRRFWLSLATVIALIIKEVVGLEIDLETIAGFVGVVIAWIVGDSIKTTE